MQPWFERDPELLERELAALKAANIAAEIDEAGKAAGVLRLRLHYPFNGGAVALDAVYPDFFPYFRPEVSSNEMKLPRHQHPLGGGLCLIGRATSRWFAEDTLADLLTAQMPVLLNLHATGNLEAVYAVEEQQGEPASDYYNSGSTLGSYVLIDSAWEIPPHVMSGTFRVRYRVIDSKISPPIVQGYVTEVLGPDQTSLAKWTGPEPAGYDKTLTGPWSRRDAPILGDIAQFVAGLTTVERDRLLNVRAWPHTRHIALAAVLFPEEVGHRTYADGWAALQWTVEKSHRGRQRSYKGSFVRTARAGQSDLAARMPAVGPLAGKTVALFGLGALGAPVAIDLARAGAGKLILVDHDVVEPSTVRRWPIGWPAFGRSKVEVLKERIALDYPWTEVKAEPMKLGGSDAPGEPRQGERLARLLDGVDLVFDATAEMGVNHFLSEWARAGGIPYVLANGTPGAWGGMVARFLPGDGSCWMCLRYALYGDTPTIERPPVDPAGETQPPGCAEPTFTGTAFDMQEVSLEAVRTIAGILAADYPALAGGVSVLKLRDGSGRISPTWTNHGLGVHPDCPCHAC